MAATCRQSSEADRDQSPYAGLCRGDLLAVLNYDRLRIADTVAPHPDDRAQLCELQLSSQTVSRVAGHGKVTKIFEMYYNVMGIVPPVNNAGYHEKMFPFPDHWGGQRHAHALFQGLRRPFNERNADKGVYVYISKPKFVYEHIPHMVCVARRSEAPEDAVFATYVLFPESRSNGVIVNWEWITADSKQADLPDDFDNRYDNRLW